MQELGHVVGLDDLEPGSGPHDLLTATLPTGNRRLPAPVAPDTSPTPVAAPTPAGSGPGGTNPASADPAVATSGPVDDRGPLPGPGVPARVFWLGAPVGEDPVAPRRSGADAGQPPR